MNISVLIKYQNYRFNWGILFVFVVFFVYNVLQLYNDIRVLQGNLQPVNKKKIDGMTFQLKFALNLPHLKSFELIHFRRRLRCVDCRFYREPEILKQVIL